MHVLRDLSVILLAAEAFVFALIPLALFGALVYGVWWLRMHEHMPTWLSKTRGYVMLGLSYVEQAMDAVARPVMAVHSAFATVEGWLSALRSREQ
jgi:hypothetical protein